MATNYTALINSMLELRNQKLKEELAQQADQAAMWQGIGSGIGSMGKALGSGMQSYQQNSTANTMMNQMDPPSAKAVDPAMQSQFTGEAGAPHTGGMAEMDMMMQMEKLRQDGLRAGMPSAAEERLAWDKSKYVTSQAQSAEKKESADLRQGFNDRDSYIKRQAAYDDAMANAKSPLEYNNAVNAKMAHNGAAIDYGMKVDPIDPAAIPPYMSPEEKSALSTQQQAVTQAQKEVDAAKKAEPGIWDRMRSGVGLTPESSVLGVPVTFDSERAIGEAQSKYEKEQQALRSMPGGSQPPVAGQPGTVPTTGASAAPATGTKRYSPSTKRTQQWDGSKWIDI